MVEAVVAFGKLLAKSEWAHTKLQIGLHNFCLIKHIKIRRMMVFCVWFLYQKDSYQE